MLLIFTASFSFKQKANLKFVKNMYFSFIYFMIKITNENNLIHNDSLNLTSSARIRHESCWWEA